IEDVLRRRTPDPGQGSGVFRDCPFRPELMSGPCLEPALAETGSPCQLRMPAFRCVVTTLGRSSASKGRTVQSESGQWCRGGGEGGRFRGGSPPGGGGGGSTPRGGWRRGGGRPCAGPPVPVGQRVRARLCGLACRVGLAVASGGELIAVARLTPAGLARRCR